MKKSLIALLIISIISTGTLFSIPAQATPIEFTYTIANSQATIVKYTGAGGNVVIPQTIEDCAVTAIDTSAFINCRSMTGVTIPDTVTFIGDYAFFGCSSLAAIDLPENMPEINYNSFAYCSGITELTIPDSVNKIHFYAFYRCKGLKKVDLGSGLTLLMDRAFQDCDGLTEITIPASVTFIGEYAFAYDENLVSATFLGMAPILGLRVFIINAPGFKVYYVRQDGGFTNPWYGNETVAIIPDAESIALNKTSLIINRGKTATLSVTFTPENADKSISWKSSNTSVATVSSTGIVKAIARGTATITATTVKGGKTATCKVTVIQPVTKVLLNKTTLTLIKGKTYRLTAKVSPINANNKSVTWKTSNKNIAAVSNKGLVRGIKKGTAYITIKTVDGGKIARCRVIVK